MKDNSLKISVIIPMYNSEKYIKRCLDSLLNQTLEDIEIICINDGSTDKTQEIVENYQKKYPFIKLINQPNLGLSTARNNGLKTAEGEYIGFVDSDDYVDNNFYEKLYTTAKEYNADIATGGIIRENNRTKKTLLSYKKIQVCENITKKFELINAPKYCFIWNKIYLRKSLMDNNINFKDGYFYEDMIFTPQTLIKLGRLVSVPDVFYHYWKHKDSVIKKDTDTSRADKLYTKSVLNSLMKEQGIKIKDSDNIKYKKDYMFLGIKLFKIYKYRATKKIYLFGLFPFLTIKEYV